MPATLTEVIEYARLAPSVHNVQPWRFSISNSTISIYIEHGRILQEGDPTKRELWISMGIILEAVCTAARGLGFVPIIQSAQTDDLYKKIAEVSLEERSDPNPELLSLLKKRHSYRGHLSPISIPDSLQASLQEQLSDLPDISTILSTNQEIIRTVADISEKGMRMALSSSAFRRELAPLLHTNWSHAATGLHGYVMEHGLLGSVWQKASVILGVDAMRQAREDQQRILESSALVFITARGDVPRFWLAAGQAYLRLVLEITRRGFAHSTLTAAVEAGRFHEEIEAKLGTNQRILSVIRIGAAQKKQKRTSPRLPVDALIA